MTPKCPDSHEPSPEQELPRDRIKELEREHRDGYQRLPPEPEEFDYEPDPEFWEEL